MTILALEFSSARRSVAIARDGKVLAEAAEENSSRETNAFGMIEKVLAETKIEREEIEMIAVGLGPGSYTGIRAAIALAQGWQLARGIKLIGVSSAEAIAAQAQAENFLGEVNVVIDAQRGEFYLAMWKISEHAREEILPLKIVVAEEIELKKRAEKICIGPEMEKISFPRAREIAELAAGKNNFVAGEELTPIYLRATNFAKVLKI
jgi:tRNA threonylcarbamoyladenosine biosynthesis protein TsaB